MINKILEELEGLLGRFIIGCALAVGGFLAGYFGLPILKELGLL